VCGEDNKAAKAQHPLENIPRQIIPNSGHFMMNENPDAFYNMLSKIVALR
jgi:pimeloyl-ACP methyl ester carboxylesterase